MSGKYFLKDLIVNKFGNVDFLYDKIDLNEKLQKF